MFRHWPTPKLRALYRVAKTRLHPFFKDPHLMIALREELKRR